MFTLPRFRVVSSLTIVISLTRYINGKRHREDGPAIIYGDGYKEYFLQGVKVTREHIIRLQRERIRHLVKIVLTNQLRVNKSHYIKALLPLIVKETFK